MNKYSTEEKQQAIDLYVSDEYDYVHDLQGTSN